MKKGVLITFFTIFLSLGLFDTSTELKGQCPMCRMSAESNLQNGGTEGKGLNKGIFLLLAMPYVMIGTIGIAWYVSHKNKQKEEAPQ